MSREAVIVATARTPIGRAYRGAFNDTDATTLGGHVVAEAVRRAGVDPAEVEDVVMGCAVQQGTTGQNIARFSALRAGLPNTVPGMTIDRACSSGLMAVAAAARHIIVDGAQVTVGGGVESVSLVMNERINYDRIGDAWQREHYPEMDTSMIETAEIVAERYGVSREAQDAYALQSQQRTAQAQAEGRYDAEIAPLTTRMRVQDKATGAVTEQEITLRLDEGNRPQTTLEDLQKLKPVFKGGRYVRRRAIHHGRQCIAAVGWRRCARADGFEARGAARARAAGRLPRPGSGWLPARGDGDRSRVRGAQAARAARAHGRRHRPLGIERSLRQPGAVLPRPARYSE